jgi:hypothetical protein
MLLAPWAIQGLKAQDFQYVPTPPDAARWRPTPKPELNPYPYALLARGPQFYPHGRKLKPTAIVRAAHGSVQYSKADQWPVVKRNMELGPGTTLRTGAESYVDLWVNGSSTIRVTALATMQLQKMTRSSAEPGADTETTLDLKSGIIVGNVKKLPANSNYEITTPHGVARIRGTDFLVQVTPVPTGGYTVMFASVTGEVECSALVDGKLVVKLLRTGESWTAGAKDINPTPPEVWNSIIPAY